MVGAFLSFGLAATVCLVVGAFGFGNRRHGAEIDMRGIIDWLSDRFRYWTAARAAPFSSPTSAQFWLEWTERGHVLPAVIGLLGSALLLLAWCLPASEGADFVRGAAGFFFAPLFVMGMFWGSRSPSLEFGNFNGTRPLSDGQVANAILKSATLGVVSSAVICGRCMAGVISIVGEYGETARLYRSVQQIGALAMLARVALCALATWSIVGFITSLILAGRRVFGIGFVLVIGVSMAGLLLPPCLRREFRPTFTQTYLLACLVLCLLVVAAAFIASWQRRLISMPALCLAAGIVLAALAMAQVGGLTREWKYLLPVILGCGLIPFPLAAAPLAVYANRHR